MCPTTTTLNPWTSWATLASLRHAGKQLLYTDRVYERHFAPILICFTWVARLFLWPQLRKHFTFRPGAVPRLLAFSHIQYLLSWFAARPMYMLVD